MRDPLIHVGYHKTGSTWLQEKVFSDPRYGFAKQSDPIPIDAAIVAPVSLKFDPDEARRSFDALFADAAATDRVPVISHERLSGDIGSGGVDSKLIADRLRATFPQGRVLIVIREQRDMLLSVYKTEVRENTFTIEQRFRDRSVIERRTPQPSLDYFEYDRLIAYYQELFGRDRVLVLTYERLRSDPLAFVGCIAAFAGVPAPTAVPSDDVNVSLPTGLLATLRYVNHVLHLPGLRRYFTGPLEERKAKRGWHKVLDKVAKITPKGWSRSVDRRWREQVSELVDGRFEASNRRTSELTGLDLAPLGYALP